jgi:cytochrome P450
MDTVPPMPGIDLQEPGYLKNPYPTFARLRERYPVCELNPGNIYALSRYDDARFALSHPELFTSGIGAMGAPHWMPEDCRRSWFIQTMDPPKHTDYRSKVNKLFVPGVIESYVPLFRERAKALVDAIPKAEVIDFTEAFAYPYVGHGIEHITGTAGEIDMEALRRGIEEREMNTAEAPAAERIESIVNSIRSDNDKYDRILADRRSNPRMDLVTELINLEVDGKPLTTEQLRSGLDLFLGAGLHTSAQTLTNAMMCLSQYPHVLQLLCAERHKIPAFIDEVMRIASPLFYQPRITTQPITLHEVTIPAASLVMILIASANRDSALFDSPDEFDIHRANNKQHLSFGYGPHFCIGAALARLEMKIALEEMLSRFTRVQCPEPRDLEWTGTLATRAVRYLPVSFE